MIDILTEYNVLGAFVETLKYTVLAAIGSLVIGTLVAVMRVSPIGVLRGLGTFYVTTIRNTPLTLLMVLQVAPDTTRHRAFQRVYGTIAGALASAVLATVFHGTWVIAVVAVIAFFGLLATMGHQPYSVYAFFLTVLVLLGVSATEPPLEASLQRIVYTVIGCALALTAYLIERRLTADDTRAA